MKSNKNKPIPSSEKYFVFSKYTHEDDYQWRYFGEFKSKEDAEIEMEFTGEPEPEPIEFMVIKGRLLDTYEGVARYPYHIQEGIE
jgi:hypothetical protein